MVVLTWFSIHSDTCATTYALLSDKNMIDRVATMAMIATWKPTIILENRSVDEIKQKCGGLTSSYDNQDQQWLTTANQLVYYTVNITSQYNFKE